MYQYVAAQSRFVTVWVTDGHVHVQRLVSVVKTVSLFEECTTEEQRTVGLNAKDIHKGIFPFYGEKCLSRKAVPNCVEKFSEERSKVEDDARLGRPVDIVTEATVKRVEELIRADRRITIDSVATKLRCSHGLAYMIILSFGKCAHGGCPEN
jgi:hypothetical protein